MPRAPLQSSSAGFSLVEVLIASTLLAVSLTTLAQLFAMAIAANAMSREIGYHVVYARGQLETLRSHAWSLDAADAALNASPPDALTTDRSGYFETLDVMGRPIDGAGVLTRRWSIAPLAVDPNALVLEVRASKASSRPGQDVRLLTMKTRKSR